MKQRSETWKVWKYLYQNYPCAINKLSVSLTILRESRCEMMPIYSLIYKILAPGTFLGKVARLPLKFLSQDRQVPILSGKLRGKKWIVGSSIHACWLGIYELDKQKVFTQLVSPGSVVYDIGANVGFYTLLASVLVGDQGHVIAFEPAQRNLKFLDEHLRLNDISNVDVWRVAVADKSGEAYFDPTTHGSTGHLDENGEEKVKTVSLDELVLSGELPAPDFIKMDIEGAELLALRGAEKIVLEHHPVIFIATHGEEVHQGCCEFLQDRGYCVTGIDKKAIQSAKEILAQRPGKGFAKIRALKFLW
jgi:FkbM family methyltransferase